jgi:prepilin-type processing-associated H-X9-DG protein
MPPRPRRAVTLTDLLVLLAILSLLTPLLLAQVAEQHAAVAKVKCAKQLRAIGQSFLMYANENKGRFPRTRYAPAAKKWTAYTGWQSAEVFQTPKGDPSLTNTPPDVNDVTAALYLIVRTQDVTTSVFVCPADKTARQWDFAPKLNPGALVIAQHRGNFPSPAFLSYSLANPYPDEAAVARGYTWNDRRRDADFAHAADMNPGHDALLKLTPDSPPADLANGNSPNHDRQGQNVLYADGHVDFATTPFAGVGRDNIYTVSASPDGSNTTSQSIWASPTAPHDSVLLPTAKEKGDETAANHSLNPTAPRTPTTRPQP